MGAAPTPSHAPAGFWPRAGAFIIDLLLTGMFFIPMFIAFTTGPTEREPCTVDEEGTVVDIGDDEDANALCDVPTAGTIAVGGLLGLSAFAGQIVYWALTEGRTGQSIGKRVTNIATVNVATGAPIGAGRAVGRYFGRILSSLPLYLGYLWMLWDRPHRQTWHDKMVSSVVVRTER